MKIITYNFFSFFVSLVLIGCSNDDTSNQNNTQDYVITLESQCRKKDTQKKYCVTEVELKKAFEKAPVGDPCPFVTIKDIQGNKHKGILVSGGTGSCNNL